MGRELRIVGFVVLAAIAFSCSISTTVSNANVYAYATSYSRRN